MDLFDARRNANAELVLIEGVRNFVGDTPECGGTEEP